MATRHIYSDFTVGQAVLISKKVLSVAAGLPGRVTSIDPKNNTVRVIVDGYGSKDFDASWLTPLKTPRFEAHEVGRWATLVGQDGSSRPVTFLGYEPSGNALYTEGHVTLSVTLADNIHITN